MSAFLSLLAANPTSAQSRARYALEAALRNKHAHSAVCSYSHRLEDENNVARTGRKPAPLERIDHLTVFGLPPRDPNDDDDENEEEDDEDEEPPVVREPDRED
jgi:hypothetical protein